MLRSSAIVLFFLRISTAKESAMNEREPECVHKHMYAYVSIICMYVS